MKAGAIIAMTVLTLVLLGACQGRSEFEPMGLKSEKRIHYIEPTYPPYESLEELVQDSTLVVQGTVTQVLFVRRVLPEGVDPSQVPPKKAAAVGYLETDFRVRVDQVLWTALSQASPSVFPEEITVSQLGGSDEANVYVVDGEPPLEVGRTYVLFLFQRPDRNYTIVGGPQGYFVVEKGKLLSIKEEGHELSPVGKRYDGVEVSTLQTDLAALRQ